MICVGVLATPNAPVGSKQHLTVRGRNPALGERVQIGASGNRSAHDDVVLFAVGCVELPTGKPPRSIAPRDRYR